MYGCKLAVRKCDEPTKTLSWFTNAKIYSLTLFKVVVRNIVLKLNRTCLLDKKKPHVMKSEREGRLRTWTIFPGSCCSSNALFHWFHHHSCTSGVRPLFGAPTKMRHEIFVSFYIVFGWWSTLVISSSRLQTN